MAVVHWQTELRYDPKAYDLADFLGITKTRAAQHLQLLYTWAADAAYSGMLIPYCPQEIADACLWTGDADRFQKALVDTGWLLTHHLTLWRFEKMVTFRRGGRFNYKHWSPIRDRVLRRDDYACQYCGERQLPLEVDHMKAVSLGGDNEMSNLITACRDCNRRKGVQSFKRFAGVI